jgi:RNA recognition motif-containing protein
MNNVFYVGKSPFGVTEEDIKELLYRIGRVVSMRFIADRHSFRPKWFGFVEMASEAEVNKVMEVLGGKMLLNRHLTTLKRNRAMLESKLCSFCISKETCKKPETERDNNCSDYMLKTESENECNE